MIGIIITDLGQYVKAIHSYSGKTAAEATMGTQLFFCFGGEERI